MYVADDLTVTERFHGVSQNIPAHGLHDVLDEFGTVTLDPGPVLCGVDPHVGNRLSSETFHTDMWFYVREPTAGTFLCEKYRFFYVSAKKLLYNY